MKNRFRILVRKNRFKIGDRVVSVSSVEFPIPATLHGKIVRVYSEVVTPHTLYEELYEVLWDNGNLAKGFFSHGLDPEPDVMEAEKGVRITQAVQAAIDRAKNKQSPITLRFNHLELHVSPESTLDQVLDNFDRLS